ncbi:thioredoxin-like 1-1, chloroplastic [Nicotiana tabacum]|uniref:Thioredoxin-like 1-1, chloroplastic n=2 Tax=Nicotiana TaxID=4085 RepID=A0A1S4B0T6_TOBAC|nr:PREDICTED: thioredoxin-like 1-1, chloroplastic [Nicotiana sylvestris]XP_016482550.1 PREDICTED: thioredoxin-like 1-1, chloroplastic [Nicotiana tabacum]
MVKSMAKVLIPSPLNYRAFSKKSKGINPNSFGISLSANNNFFGRNISLRGPLSMRKFNIRNPRSAAATAQMSIGIRKAPKWWEKGLQPNMKEVTGAQDLVDSLVNAGDKLVIVDFFSPGCGGCKALHPKICQLAEMNPDVQFLQVNYEEHKSMCYSLNVHVLPFFRFYRGAEGRLCSFSCTNATIKKFKDALAKYGADCCSLGPAKGLEEKELLALAANKDLSFAYTPKQEEPVLVALQEDMTNKTSRTSLSHPNAFPPLPLPRPLPLASTSHKVIQGSKSEAC